MDQPRETDEWLMDQLAQGRQECLTSLVERHAQPLFAYIWRMLGDRHRAEELFQEVFLAVWAKRRQYEFPRPFRPWLYAIATNVCRADFRRSSPGATSLDELSPADREPTPADAAETTENARLVLEAVGELPAQQRLVVVLRVWNGFDYADIATAAGCSEATVRSHMHHALATLRRFLEPRM